MSSAVKCFACKTVMKKKVYMICCVCEHKYDLQCANISEKLYNSFDNEQKRIWTCLSCHTKISKMDNTTADAGSTEVTSPASLSDTLTNDSIDSEDFSNVTIRAKKQLNSSKFSDSSTNPDSIRDIIKQELTEIVSRHVTTELKAIKQEVFTFREAMDFFNKQYEDLKSALEEKSTIISKLSADNIVLQSTVTDLSNRLTIVEQHMRESNLEINGIPEHRNENLVNTIMQLSNSVDNPVKEDDILRATRVAKLDKSSDVPRAVVVKLRSPRVRDSILAAVTKFNKKNATNKLNSHHLGLAGSRTPVFVAEHLTPSNKALHAATRKKCKEMKYKFVWVRNGRIYVRKDESCSAITIRSLDSLGLIT